MLPAFMQAVSIVDPGKTSGRLLYGRQPLPHLGEGQVLVRVMHAGVNRADIFQRQGSYPPPEGASPLPGLEVSGHIAALSKDVTGLRVGDPVCALLAGGGYAEYAVAEAGHILPVPKKWSLAEAAAFPEAMATIWMALAVETQLQKGETLLVHGGASGIGMMALAYAKNIGARIIVTAGTSEKCAAALSWGAEHAICYREEDFVAAVAKITENRGVNVVLDIVGGDYIARNFAALAKGGRMISLAFLRGARLVEIGVAPLLLKQLTWKGATLRTRSIAEKSIFIRDMQNALSASWDSGFFKPHIDKSFALSDAEKAQFYMEENRNIGKLVLKVESAYS